jgi:hypothetical protein
MRASRLTIRKARLDSTAAGAAEAARHLGVVPTAWGVQHIKELSGRRDRAIRRVAAALTFLVLAHSRPLGRLFRAVHRTIEVGCDPRRIGLYRTFRYEGAADHALALNRDSAHDRKIARLVFNSLGRSSQGGPRSSAAPGQAVGCRRSRYRRKQRYSTRARQPALRAHGRLQ